MSSFQLFRTRMNNEMECKRKFETRFITDGASAIQIYILRLEKERDATMVFTDTEGPDSAIIFTPKQRDNEEDLIKTDYYTWNNKLFFVYEDVFIARNVSYIKQKAYQCNTTVRVLDCDQEDKGGYFISSLRTYIDTELQNNINIVDKEHPILIMPAQEWIEIGAKIEIGGKPWRVIDFDAITNPGIVYMSLDRDFFKKGTDIIIDDGGFSLKAGITHTMFTQDGYFYSSSPLKIKSRTADKIEFEIPYGLDYITIGIKNSSGTICENNYRVVL